MAINRDTIRYVADLARIGLSEKELDDFTGQVDRILEYVHKLKKLDVKDLGPTSHVLEMKNIYREDEVRDSLPVEDVLKNAPLRQSNMFKVKKIIEA